MSDTITSKHHCGNCNVVVTVNDDTAKIIAIENAESGELVDGMEFGLHTIHHLHTRLEPGGIVPSGQCPDCNCFCYPATSGDANDIAIAQHPEDVYILLPRERDTIIAALRVWQEVSNASSRRFFANNFDFLMLDDITTNGGSHDSLDENEIDILIENKINASRPSSTTLADTVNAKDERVSHSSKHRVVVSVSGGLVQAVYGDDSAVEVLTVDHDNIEQGDDGVCDEHLIPLDLLKDNETAEAIQKYLEPDSDDLCDTCMRSGVAIARTDEDGNTVCVECDED